MADRSVIGELLLGIDNKHSIIFHSYFSRRSTIPLVFEVSRPCSTVTRSTAQLLGNSLRSNIHHPKCRMKGVEPKVLIHGNTARSIKRVPARSTILIRNTIVRGVLVRARLDVATWVIEDLVEYGIGIEEESSGVMVCPCEVLLEFDETVVPVLDVSCLERLGCGALCGGQWCSVDWRHVEEEEVASAGLVELVDEASVLLEDDGIERGILCSVAVANVVDSDEDAEESVVAGPWEE